MMNQHLLVTTLILCAITWPSVALDASTYKRSLQLDDGLTLYWNVDGDKTSIQFGVTGKTSGYIAIGISEVGAMTGSDIMFGTVSNGKAMVLDAFAFNKSKDASGLTLGVMADSQQDITTIAGAEYADANGDTWTSLEFSRPLNTSDCNDRPILEGTTQLIWAMGSTDEMVWHGLRRGGVHLALLGQTYLENTYPPFSEALNLTAPRYNVPSKYTTYACTTFNLSALLPAKKHALGWDVIINSTAPSSVHHFVLYACNGEQEIAGSIKLPPSRDCTETGPLCSGIVASWAVGGKALVLPDNVGMPLGPGTPNEIVVLETHYTNPEGRTDIWDASGVSFPLAQSLRVVEAGTIVLGVGNEDKMIQIPPNQESWLMENSCTTGCTKDKIYNNITIIGSFLHQHLLGKQIWTTLKRNGKEIATVNRADYYAFDFQQWVQPTNPLVMYPGDELHTVCIWDSRGRNTTTFGGVSTQQEMCFNFLLYYPLKQSVLTACMSSCMNLGLLQEMQTGKANATANPFAPFNSIGAVYASCGDNDTLTNTTCKYGDMMGRSEVLPRLHGCPTKSLLSVTADVQSGLQVPATIGAAISPPADALSCMWPFNGRSLRFQNCRTLSGNFTLNWNLTSRSSSAVVAVSHRHDGWIAFGLSPTGKMVGSSVIVARPATSQGVSVQSYFLGAYSRDAVQPPGQLSASDLQGESVGGEMRMLFTLQLTSDQLESSRVLWAKGGYSNTDGETLQQHKADNAYLGTVSFKGGVVTTKKKDNLRNIHGVLNAISWGLLIPTGAIIARYGKTHDPGWFYGHMAVQSSGFILGLAGFITGVVLRGRAGQTRVAHFTIAITILILSAIQMLAIVLRPKKVAEIRPLWNALHHNVGRLVIVLSIVNVAIGFSILKPGTTWIASYSSLLAVLFVAVLVLEVSLRSKKGVENENEPTTGPHHIAKGKPVSTKV